MESDKSKNIKMWYGIAKKIALISVILALVLSVLMVVNYLQTRSLDPMNSKVISQMILKLQENPEDTALKEEIRALDLLARKAYFTHSWQVRTGSALLFVFVLLFLVALKYMNSLQSRLPDLEEESDQKNEWTSRLLSRKSIIFSGLGIFILALVLGFLSESELKKFGRPDQKAKAGKGMAADEIRKHWPAFRGPEGNAVSYHEDLPTVWDGPSEKNILWKIPVPEHGYNSPIIWGNKIFLSGADRRTQIVFCVDSETGEILWQAELNDIPGTPETKPNVSQDTGYAAPTMAADGKGVYVIFGTGDVACLDFDGKRVWAKNLGVPDNHYGHSSSLITYQDLLLVQYDQITGGRLIALKSDTGDLAYDKERNVEISWASPILVNTGKRAELILNSNPDVVSYDPATGEELWRVACMMGEVAPSPAYADGMVFAVNDYARLAGIKLGETAELVWEFLDDLSEVSSLLATKDYVFMAASWGAVSCFNTKTGERYWIQEYDEGFYSSPILAGGNVYLMNMDGIMFVFKADKEFQLVSQNTLGERAVTIPAFMDKRIYIRGQKHLFCIGNSNSEKSSEGSS